MPQNKRTHRPETQKTSEKRKSLREPVSDSEEVKLEDVKKNINNLHLDIKKLWKNSQKNRFKIIQTSKGPYKSDRWIWQGVILFCFLWLWFIAHSYDYNLDYYKCGEGDRLYEGAHQKCKNPFYKPGTSWKCSPELPYGEYGTKPGPLFNNAGIVAFGILVLGGLVNHVWHNRRYR